jgi:hypothetical protein
MEASPMYQRFRRDRDPLRTILAAILILAAAVAAFAITRERDNSRIVSHGQPAPGASGIARPHPPLDRAPGEPLQKPM